MGKQRLWVAEQFNQSNWKVYPMHPSGDGSKYAAITGNLDVDDARLIAAAPELLAALESALPLLRTVFLQHAEKYVGTRFENDPAYKQVEARYKNAEAAIARATNP